MDAEFRQSDFKSHIQDFRIPQRAYIATMGSFKTSKRKADQSNANLVPVQSKKAKLDTPAQGAAPSHKNLLDDSDSDSDDGQAGEGGASLKGGFKVNEEFAKKFEHNKKREEKQRCQSSISSS